MKIIKIINVFVFTIIIFFMPSTYAMERAATEHNEQFSLMLLPKEIHYNICNQLFNDKINNLSNLLKFALALRSTCTYFKKLLTVTQLSQLCTPFDQKSKNNTLEKVSGGNKIAYPFPCLILMNAKTSLNTESLLVYNNLLYDSINKTLPHD